MALHRTETIALTGEERVRLPGRVKADREEEFAEVEFVEMEGNR